MPFRDFISKLHSEIVLSEVSYTEYTPGHVDKDHFHVNRLHISFIKSGYGTCVLNGKNWKMTPGSVFVIAPGEFHHYATAPEKPYKVFFMHFDWFGSVPEELARRIIIPRKERKRFFSLLAELATLYGTPPGQAGPDADYRVYGLCSLVIADLIKFSAEAGKSDNKFIPNSSHPHLNHIFKQLYGPPFSFPGIDALAEHCGISARSLASLFRQQTGMSIKQYYLYNLMTYARTMLDKKELKLREIARNCGYSNSQNFLAAYRKHQKKYPEKPVSYH